MVTGALSCLPDAAVMAYQQAFAPAPVDGSTACTLADGTTGTWGILSSSTTLPDPATMALFFSKGFSLVVVTFLIAWGCTMVMHQVKR